MRLTILSFSILLCCACHAAQTVDYLLNFEGSGSISAASLLPTVNGPTNANTWTGILGAGNMSYDALGQRALLGPVTVNNYGSFSGSGITGLKCSSAGDNHIWFTPTNSPVSMSIGCWFYTDLANNANPLWDVFTLYDTTGGSFLNMEIAQNGGSTSLAFYLEDSSDIGTAGNQPQNFSNISWNWLTIGWNVTNVTTVSNYVASLYDVNTNLIGTMGVSNKWVGKLAGFVAFGIQNNTVNARGYNCYYDSAIVDTRSATFPLLPGSPAPPAPSPTFTLGSATVGNGKFQ